MNDALELAVNVSKSIFSFVYFALMLVSSVAFIYILVALILNFIIPVLNFEMPYLVMYLFGSPPIHILDSVINLLGVAVAWGLVVMVYSRGKELNELKERQERQRHQRQKQGAK